MGLLLGCSCRTALTESGFPTSLIRIKRFGMCEIWRKIEDHPLYEVSNLGRIKSWMNYHSGIRKKPNILTGHGGRGKYLRVYMNKKVYLVHRLVLTTFKGSPPSDKPQCGHRDGNPKNNRLDNLRWVTPLENAKDRERHGMTACGERSGGAKLTEYVVRQIRDLFENDTKIAKIAKLYNTTRRNVYAIIKKETWRHTL